MSNDFCMPTKMFEISLLYECMDTLIASHEKEKERKHFSVFFVSFPIVSWNAKVPPAKRRQREKKNQFRICGRPQSYLNMRFNWERLKTENEIKMGKKSLFTIKNVGIQLFNDHEYCLVFCPPLKLNKNQQIVHFIRYRLIETATTNK